MAAEDEQSETPKPTEKEAVALEEPSEEKKIEDEEKTESAPIENDGTQETNDADSKEVAQPEPAPQDKKEELMENTDENSGSNEEVEEEADDQEGDALATRQALLEARAIDEATASADSSYVPSPSLLADTSPYPLLKQVDGPHLKNYTGSPNVYQARDIPLAIRGKLEVPIYITSGGSVVEFSVESQGYDIAFGVVAERENKETVVKTLERVDTNLKPCTGKFLVGTVPCVLIFTFDNDYSWFTEKIMSYSITVSPPSKENVLVGRRRRAKSALKSVEKDRVDASNRLEMASKQKEALAASVSTLEKRLAEQKENLDAVTNEEDFLKNRVDLRSLQCDALKDRLTNGWEDEDAAE